MDRTRSIPYATIALIAVVALSLAGFWIMILREMNSQVKMIMRTYQEMQLTLLRTTAATVEAYTSLRNPHRIEINSGWYEREIYVRFIDELKIFEDSQAWLFSGDRLTGDDPGAFPAGVEVYIVPVTGMAPANTLEPDAGTIFKEITAGKEGMGVFSRQDGGEEEIISWAPIDVGGEIWTIGMTTPLATILSATRARDRFQGMFWQVGIITVLSLGVVVAWGREAFRRNQAAVLLKKTNMELESRVLERTRALTQANQDLVNEVAKHQDTEAVLKRQIQRFEAVHKIDTLVSAGVDIHVTIHYMLEQALLQRGVDAGAVYLLDGSRCRLTLADGMGFHADVGSFPAVTRFDSWSGAVAFSGDMLFQHSIARNPYGWKVPNHLADEGFVSYLALPLKAKGEVKGVCELYSRTGLDDSLEWIGFLDTLAGTVAIAVDNAILVEQLKHKNIELSDAYDATLEGWSRAIELHDRESEGHSQRVVDMTVQLARRMCLPEEQMIHVRRGALLHDIGKMGIPDTVLQKTGPLNSEERKQIQMHPEYAYRMLSPVAYLAPAMDIPYCHHERWDGNGYPRGLSGEEIPIAARVFSVIDVWDALRSDRPYRRAWTNQEARDYIRSQTGKQFDPFVVAAFLEILDESDSAPLT